MGGLLRFWRQAKRCEWQWMVHRRPKSLRWSRFRQHGDAFQTVGLAVFRRPAIQVVKLILTLLRVQMKWLSWFSLYYDYNPSSRTDFYSTRNTSGTVDFDFTIIIIQVVQLILAPLGLHFKQWVWLYLYKDFKSSGTGDFGFTWSVIQVVHLILLTLRLQSMQ